MLKHSREEWNGILQKLMNMMEDDYPNNYELIVNSFSAEIRSNLTDMCFTRENILKPSEPVAVKDSKLGKEKVKKNKNDEEPIEMILRCEDLDWNKLNDVRTVACRLEGMYMDLEENFNNKCSYCEDRYKFLLQKQSESVTVDISKLGDPNNKTFDVVEAFHRMLLGRKVRRVDWESEEWIELTPKYYVIRNQRETTMNLSILVCLESREAMWEEYEEGGHAE